MEKVSISLELVGQCKEYNEVQQGLSIFSYMSFSDYPYVFVAYDMPHTS